MAVQIVRGTTDCTEIYRKEAPTLKTDHLPSGSADRKSIPMATGVLDYFPNALVEVAKVSVAGNAKHRPGKPLRWQRGTSNDHADALLRHLLERGGLDPDTGVLHSAELAWRALALLETELEKAGAKPGRASLFPDYDPPEGTVAIKPAWKPL